MEPLPLECIKILDSYLKIISLNREQHATIQKCLMILTQHINKGKK